MALRPLFGAVVAFGAVAEAVTPWAAGRIVPLALANSDGLSAALTSPLATRFDVDKAPEAAAL